MSHIITVKCDTCGHNFDIDIDNYDIEWELAESFDHGDNAMGEENHFETMISQECPVCHETINVNLNIWEYPVGSYNDQNIEVEGADKVNACDISYFSPIGG